MVRYDEHSIKFLQLTDSLHVLQITLADNSQVNKKKEKNVMTKLMKALLPLHPLIADSISFIVTETVRVSKCSKLNSFLLN